MIEKIKLDEMNRLLKDRYGMFDVGKPNFRIVFSDEQFEKRFGKFEDRTPEGFFIRLFEGVREVPKYQHIRERWILERITPVLTPESQKELLEKSTYYCVWQFMGPDGSYREPNLELAIHVIESIYEAAAKAIGAKYKNPEDDPKIAKEVREARLSRIYEALYGNETPTTDALATRRGVTVPETYEAKQNELSSN